jgi:acetylornithine deacetylase/succinyl-diaminopimelate desuccinylase-like protein
VGEEQDGMWYLVREHKPLVDAEFAINPDGGSGDIDNGKRMDFGIETSEKTYVTFTLETTNKGGHSSEPRPDNAIYQLARTARAAVTLPVSVQDQRDHAHLFREDAASQTGQPGPTCRHCRSPTIDLAAPGAWQGRMPPSMRSCIRPASPPCCGRHQENALAGSATATVQCRIMPDETVEGTKATIEKLLPIRGSK